MTCARARKLFGACWDDEITQGEREWLDAHLNTCGRCRTEYDSLARTLETVASLPRVEAAPDLADRVLAEARRAAPAVDRLPQPERRWVPLTAAAAAAVLVVTLVAPWAGWIPGGAPPTRMAQTLEQSPDAIQQAVPVARPVGAVPPLETSAEAEAEPGFAAIAGDSLFDHSEDVDFILDPVALRRGRAHPLPATGTTDGIKVERAVISF
jgi:anti-sigma factor RsiW